MPTKRNNAGREAEPAWRALRGLTRARVLEAGGASRTAIRRRVGSGELEQVARGLYAPAGFQATEHHGLASAAALVPDGVVCLLSALQLHDLGTQAPFEVWLAIGGKARKPNVTDPPLRI